MPKSVDELFPTDRYELIPKVAVFKTHQRVKNGRLVTVNRTDLEAIASNHNQRFERIGRAAPFAKGHTLDAGPDGADVPETDQPNVCGFGVRFVVDREPNDPDDEYLYCDLYLKKRDRDVLEDYPAISPEYFPNAKRLYPISFLKSSAPELDLPPVLHRYENEDESYRLTMTNPLFYSTPKETEMNPMMDEKKDDKKPDDKPEEAAKKEAVQGESKGAKEDKSDLSEVKSLLAQLQPLLEMLPDLQALVGLMKEEGPADEGDGKEDLMSPAMGQGKDGMPAPATEKGPDKPKAEDDGKPSGEPVKFDSGMPSATNCNIPGYSDKDKAKMSADKTDDLVKYKVMEDKVTRYEAELAAVKKVADDLNKKNRLAEAEKAVAVLEKDHLIQYHSEKERAEDIETIAALDPKSASIFVDRAKVRYQKRLPDPTSVKEVGKYAVEGEPSIAKLDPAEVDKLAQKIVASGKSYNEYMASLATAK